MVPWRLSLSGHAESGRVAIVMGTWNMGLGLYKHVNGSCLQCTTLTFLVQKFVPLFLHYSPSKLSLARRDFSMSSTNHSIIQFLSLKLPPNFLLLFTNVSISHDCHRQHRQLNQHKAHTTLHIIENC